MPFYDDFERALLGGDWADDGPIFEDDGYVRGAQFLADGAWQAEDLENELPDAGMASIRYVPETAGDQCIEAEVGNFFQGHDPSVPEYQQYVEGYVYLFAQISGTNESVGARFLIDSLPNGPDQGDGRAEVEFFTTDALGARNFTGGFGDVTPLPGWQANSNYVIKLDVTAAGHVSAYFEGDLLAEEDVTPLGGNHVGIGMEWNLTSYPIGGPPNPGESFRFEWVSGCLAVSGWRVGRVGWGSSPW